jgi:glucosamine-6-phosphate deaminase
MEIIIKKDYGEMSSEAALIVAEELKKKARTGMPFKLGLATGGTPIGLYGELARMCAAKKLDFSTVITFNLDEYVGLAPTHERSYRRFMNENLFKRINIQIMNTHVPNGLARNLEKHCEEYDAMIKDAGGLDLQVLGLGRDGHIGFNEPGSSLASRTRIKTLAEETISDNSRFFRKKKDVPRYAITMGVGTILESRKILLLASGPQKASVLARAVEGPVTSEITASALQLHPYVIVVCDEEAASSLKRKEYYRHVYRSAQKLKGARV